MKELVEVIAKALVDSPDEVVVTETVSCMWRRMIWARLSVSREELQKRFVPWLRQHLPKRI